MGGVVLIDGVGNGLTAAHAIFGGIISSEKDVNIVGRTNELFFDEGDGSGDGTAYEGASYGMALNLLIDGDYLDTDRHISL